MRVKIRLLDGSDRELDVSAFDADGELCLFTNDDLQPYAILARGHWVSIERIDEQALAN